MTSKHEESIDLSKPALVLVHGTASRKHRLLDQDSLIVGRARGSDLGLDAPDISSLHCVITRRPDGFRIRDCGSRSGTRVNGVKVRDERLDDGDLLQVGPFSFRVHLPAAVVVAAPRPASDERLIQRLQRSRKNFARQALRHRQLARGQQDHGAKVPSQLKEETAALCARVREYEQRLRQLEDGERDLTRDRDLLQREQHGLEKRVRLFDQELKERRATVETEAAERRRQVEAEGQQGLEQKRQELEREHERLTRWQEELTQRVRELESEHRETKGMSDNWLTSQEQVCAQLERQGAAIAEAEQALRGQRESLAEMVAELHKLLAAAPAHDGGGAGVPAHDENELLRQALQEARRRHDEELQALRQEQETLLERLQDRERQHQEGVQSMRQEQERLRQAVSGKNGSALLPRGPGAQSRALQGEVELLRQLLQEKDALIKELEKKPKRSAQSEMDINLYEEELNQYRRQLDEEQERLNQEIKSLRERNAELDEATRDMELEMARERAELARERTRMERMREDIRLETERLQRDNGVRERLGSLNKLREELNDRKPPPQAMPAEGQSLSGRLNNRRNRNGNGNGGPKP